MRTIRKAKLGLLLMGCDRFYNLGVDTPEGSYHQRCRTRATQIVKDLDVSMDVVYDDIIYTTDQMSTLIRKFQWEQVDLVVALFLSWTQDRAWNTYLRDMPAIPTLYAHEIRNVTLGDTHEDSEFTDFLCNAGLVATLQASGDNKRYQRPMMYQAVGTWKDIQSRILTLARAAVTRSMLQKAHFGLMDCYNEVMWSTYVDPYSLFMQVGPELHFLSVAELKDIVNEVNVQVVHKKVAALCAKYEVLPGVDEEKLIASVRATIALEQQAREHCLDLLVLNDVDDELLRQIGLRPGFYPLSVPSESCLMVPEGDVGSGIAMFALQTLSREHVNYLEPFYVDPKQRAIVAGHAGPNDYTDTKGLMKISRDVRFEKTSYQYAGAPFAWYTFPPGNKTMLHCSQRNGRFQFVVTQVEFLPCEHFIASYSHGIFRPKTQSCEELLEKLIYLGVTQHYLIAPGNHVESIRDLAAMLDFDFIVL